MKQFTFWMVILLAGLPACCFSSHSASLPDELPNDWVEKITERTDPEAMQWIKEKLTKDKQLEILRNAASESLQLTTKKCSTVTEPVETDIPLYVMISFSVPDSAWVSLSNAMETCGAVFVLRGLPDNSFKELSKKIQHLNHLGVKAPIQINPKHFSDYQITHVPTFLIIEDDTHRKISGNISLAYAIEKMGGIE